jgi:hypothetical protein
LQIIFGEDCYTGRLKPGGPLTGAVQREQVLRMARENRVYYCTVGHGKEIFFIPAARKKA